VNGLHVATLNIRNLADRWDERLPLLLSDMAALQPDLIGLQEVVYPMQQDRLIGAAGEGRYGVARAWAGRPEYGNAALIREPRAATEVERLELGLNRSALRFIVVLDGAVRLLFAVIHLHHVPADEAERDEQTRLAVDWLATAPAADAQVLVGDFNATPDERAPNRLRAAGYRSAFMEANGREPEVTWPSGLDAPAKDTDGNPGCLDYIWIRGAVSVESARVVFDRPAVDDPTLYPSDHFGIAARLSIGSAT
jgi:endonuclease/exonuclease/phosphatase family metal-dependent hydrolase